MSGPGQWGEGYADVAKRHGQNGRATTGARGHWTGKVALIPERLDEPLRWRKPQRIFVNSMSDLFHEALSFTEVNRVFAAMARAPQHTFQVLTKRPVHMIEFFEWATLANAAVKEWPLPNVHLGVSVEDQGTADARIPLLLQTPAARRFVSYEPALGPVNFEPFLQYPPFHESYKMTFGPSEHRGLDWVIVGGESGPGARPFDLAWARETVRQCREAQVAVFVKQMGAHPRVRMRNGTGGWLKLASPKGGDMSEWPEDLRVREFPT
jgi:protein gp37